MNTSIKTSKNLIKLALISSLLFSVTTAYAKHSIKIETVASKSAKIINVSTSMLGNSLYIRGKLKHQPGSSLIKRGKIKIELMDADGKLLKTVITKQRRHTHYVNRDYKFSTSIPVDSHNVSMIKVQYEIPTDKMH